MRKTPDGKKYSALEYRVRGALSAIKYEAFGNVVPLFDLDLKSEARQRGYNGKYDVRTRTISIYNLTRPPRHIIVTALHELAHHCEYSLYGNTGHQKSFYMVYIDLMNAALKLGIFSYHEVQGISDSASIRQIEHYNQGPLEQRAVPECRYKKGRLLIYAFNSFQARSQLQNAGYHYNAPAKAWEKEIDAHDRESEYAFLKSLPGNINPVCTDDFCDMTVYMTITVIGETYQIKEKLNAKGFRYHQNLIGFDCPGWIKQVRTTSLSDYDGFMKELKGTSGVNVDIR